MKVLVLHDAVGPDASADERDVLDQRDAVLEALAKLGHAAESLPVTLDLQVLADRVTSDRPDVVFNLVESLGGHGRLFHVPLLLLEALGVPYTGTRADAMMRATSKLASKRVLLATGLPTPAHVEEDDLRAGRTVPAPVIVKSVWEHASIGLDEDSVLDDARPERLLDEIERRRSALRGEGYVESFVDGREFNLSVIETAIGLRVLPPAEILFVGYGPERRKVVGYRAKWDPSSDAYHATTRSFDFEAKDLELLTSLTHLARRAFLAFGLRGHARVDFRVGTTGRPTILEVNANPCLSPDAGFAAALSAGQLPFDTAIAHILASHTRERGRLGR